MLTPTLNSTGKFILKSPWQTMEDVEYKVEGVLKFTSLLERGTDVLTEVYIANGLTSEDYNNDLSKGASVVLLKSPNEDTIYVPDTYILEYPHQDQVPYNHVVCAISLGAIPDTLSLESLNVKLQQLVRDEIGIDATVKNLIAPTKGCIGYDEHLVIEENRKAAIVNSKTDRAQVLMLETINDKLRNHITLLEQQLINQ